VGTEKMKTNQGCTSQINFTFDFEIYSKLNVYFSYIFKI
jgi:hypothetical protein